MKTIREIMSEQEFIDVLQEKRLVVVEFFADWCKVCKMQNPILKDFHLDTAERVEIISVDVDLLPEIADNFSIYTIPSTALFVNGKLVEKKSGLNSKGSLAEMVIKYV